jgi:SAM-dependent methyltransferase
MLELGRSEAVAAGVENMLFLRGDGTSLPFLDGTFAVVLCGFALHHLVDPQAVLSEVKRVLIPHGWLGLADMVVSEDREIAAHQNDLERLRNPSFTRALSASELQDSLARLGYEVTGAETRSSRREVDGWLEQTHTPHSAAAQIRSLLRAELAGGPATGLTPQVEGDGSLTLGHTHTSLLVLNRDG